MRGYKELKPQLNISEDKVECPVMGCSHTVERQRQRFITEPQFRCPECKIYISPTTFEYAKTTDNLLWKDASDLTLLDRILLVKRESRMARDNSEDAVTWNVFRYLERNNLLKDFLSNLTNNTHSQADIIYWSYSQESKHTFCQLDKARIEFGEAINRGSEPDIIVLTDKALFIIEAKITAKNETTPSENSNRKKYISGDDNLFSQVFASDYQTVAIKEKMYELMRFWLLGSWMAKSLGIDFHLLSLVCDSRDKDIESEFGKHIIQSDSRQFKRITWEDIYSFISDNKGEGKEKVIDYYKNKTIGYVNNVLVKAFGAN